MNFTKNLTVIMFPYRHKLARNFISFQILKRFKSKKSRPKIPGCFRAINHFDDFYKSIFKGKWPSIRLALLTEEKSIAIVNNFGDVEQTKNLLQSHGAFNLKDHLEHVKTSLIESKKTKELLGDERAININNVIENYASEKEEEEINVLYPDKERSEFPAVVVNKDSLKDKMSNDKRDDEYDYSPEDSMTSLQHDLNKAQIATDRLILPGSVSSQGSLHEFVPATTLRSNNEYISESEYYKFYQVKSEISYNIEKEENICFPEQLKAYTFDRGDVSYFPDPIRCVNDVYNFYELNGGDLLVVLALGLEEGDSVLDMCSPTGSKAFCIFQSLLAKILVCNKNRKAENIFREYLYDYSPTWNEMLLMTKIDCSSDVNTNLFTKILVDVPCTDDRLSLSDGEDNFFFPKNLKERLQLPEYQTSLLADALKLVVPGGAVVYSTSTLSPIQNDGVVAEALRIVWNETKMEFTIKDLSPALEHYSQLFRFARGLKYGTLILPFIPSNFGPRYLCKIVRK